MTSVRSVILIALLAYVTYQVYREPVPVESSQKIPTKIIFTLYKVVHPLSLLLDRIGVVRDDVFKKSLVHNAAKMLNFGNSGVTTEDTTFDGVPVRVYRPVGSIGVLPGMVYYHGGGWTVGSIESHDPATAFFSKEANMVVVSVDYRLSPEYSQREGLDDCVTATKHFINSAHKYSVDPKRVVVAGDSAGGNYATAVSLLLRDEKFQPMPKIQMLIYPSVQAIDLQLPSFQQNAEGPFLDRHELVWYMSMVHSKGKSYLEDFYGNKHVPKEVRKELAKGALNVDLLPKEQLYPPYKPAQYEEPNLEIWNKRKDFFLDGYLAPLFAKDLSKLPEAYIFTAQYDQLRDEGYLYAHRLREAGVAVTHYNCAYGWHGMINALNQLEDAHKVLSTMAMFIKERL